MEVDPANFAKQSEIAQRVRIVASEKLKERLRESGIPFHEEEGGSLVVELSDTPSQARARSFIETYGRKNITKFPHLAVLTKEEAEAHCSAFFDKYPVLKRFASDAQQERFKNLTRGEYVQVGTKTGRFQSKTPNIARAPVDYPRLRLQSTASDIDYSAVEMRIAAELEHAEALRDDARRERFEHLYGGPRREDEDALAYAARKAKRFAEAYKFSPIRPTFTQEYLMRGRVELEHAEALRDNEERDRLLGR